MHLSGMPRIHCSADVCSRLTHECFDAGPGAGYVRLQGEHAYMFGKQAVAQWAREQESIIFQVSASSTLDATLPLLRSHLWK
jgi:hypothetical protein